MSRLYIQTTNGAFYLEESRSVDEIEKNISKKSCYRYIIGDNTCYVGKYIEVNGYLVERLFGYSEINLLVDSSDSMVQAREFHVKQIYVVE